MCFLCNQRSCLWSRERNIVIQLQISKWFCLLIFSISNTHTALIYLSVLLLLLHSLNQCAVINFLCSNKKNIQRTIMSMIFIDQAQGRKHEGVWFSAFWTRGGEKLKSWVYSQSLSRSISLSKSLKRFIALKPSFLHIGYLLCSYHLLSYRFCIVHQQPRLAASLSSLGASGNPGCDDRSWCCSKILNMLLRLWFRML